MTPVRDKLQMKPIVLEAAVMVERVGMAVTPRVVPPMARFMSRVSWAAEVVAS